MTKPRNPGRAPRAGESGARPAGATKNGSRRPLLSTPPLKIVLGALPTRVSDEILRSAFDRSPTGMSVADVDGRWLRVNDAWCRMLGYRADDLLGKRSQAFTHPDDLRQDRLCMDAAIADELECFERNKRYVCRNGSLLWAHVRAELIRDDAGLPLYFVSHLEDLSERRAARALLQDSARTLRSVVDNTPAMICVKDRGLRYQLVNREFEQWSGLPSEQLLGRSAGELPGRPLPTAQLAKEQLVLDGGGTTQAEETIVRDGRDRVFLTTRFPLLDELGSIHAVGVMSTDITERHVEQQDKRERLQCAEMIYSALAQDRFVLHGQPIVELGSMRQAKLELLIRMRTERGGAELLAPHAFLPAAERFDLITVIDEWVIDRAIELAASDHGVTVNVSAKTVSDARQVDRIEEAVILSGARASNLVFEITETAVADNLEAARSFALRMRQLGCAIALDDFGVGHGSFTYLRHLPLDYLKIDMQFVRDLLIDEEDLQVVVAIVGVARQFGIETIAEGVEDQATLDALRGMGVDYVQGYLTGRPQPLQACSKSPGSHRRARV